MSLWSRIADALSALATGEGLIALFDGLRAPPERTVGFTIAVIALGAKMAKADGRVTRAEVSAFRRVFNLPPEEEGNAARVFDLARQDVAGFDAYATRIGAMFADADRAVLTDLLEGLFHIALADGAYHPGEADFLERVAVIFRIEARAFGQLRARFVEGALRDPHDVLGVPHDATRDEARRAWKALVRQSHPAAMIARGVPPEAVQLATGRMAAINAAWAEISARAAAASDA